MRQPKIHRIAVAAAPLLLASGPVAAANAGFGDFGTPQRVTIRKYSGDAMEPFITKDGRYLLFNNRNDPRIDTRLHWSRRIDDLTFEYVGVIGGTNTRVLEGVPSLDRDGNLYFISTRSYSTSLSTIYRGRFERGRASGVKLVDGVSRRQPGMLSFDAEISADGKTLFVVDGRFTGGEVPESADIDMAARDGVGFRRVEGASDTLKHVNTGALEYAPAPSEDLLELFFTRLDLSARDASPVILRTTRASADARFGPPERIESIMGFVEAPSLSADGRSLYYHAREGAQGKERFVIYRVAR